MNKCVFFLFFALTTGIIFADSFSVADRFKIKELSEVQISADGKWVAFVQKIHNLEKDRIDKQIVMVSTAGGDPVVLTHTDGKNDHHPRWSPDNRFLAFLSDRQEDK